MAMHLNSWGLQERGYKLVAAYECFKKGERKFNIECYENSKDKEYLVRFWDSGRHAYDILYDNKEYANAKVKQLWSFYSFHKRVF